MISVFLLLCCAACCPGDRLDDECGLEAVHSKVLVRGGTAVKPNQFPWHVAIFRMGDNQFEQICGGSLVRSQLVITAAHCFSLEPHDHQVNVADYRVVGGVLFSSWNSTEIGRQESEVCTVRLGEEYGGSYRYYQDDIAVVQLMTTFTFSDSVRAACLALADPEPRLASAGSEGEVAGWGLTESGTPSDSLNFLRVVVVGIAECLQKLPTTFLSYLTSDKICAGHTGGSAVCQGDSGGGLVFPLRNATTGPPRWYLRAVLSNSPTSYDINNPCLANGFALYTNVSKHQTWLARNLESLQGAVCSARGSVGICQNSSDLSAREEASRGILPESYSPSNTDVCCVESTCPSTASQRMTGSKANDYCVDLTEKLFSCQQNGSSWSRGDLCGSELDKRRPGIWMARLAKTMRSKDQQYALGQEISTAWSMRVFLVSERWLLAKATDWDYMRMYPGRTLTSTPEVTFTLDRVVFHPQYRSENTTTDNILLMKMKTPVTFSRSLRPVCLHTGARPLRDYAGDLTVSGFDVFDSKWHQYPADPLARDECGRLFPPNSIGRPDGVTDRHTCVTSRPSCAASYWYLTACDGHRVACTQLLVGLFLDYEAEDYSCNRLFLRVAPYVPWVESVVWP